MRAANPAVATGRRGTLTRVGRELFPAEQAPVVQLLVDRIDVSAEAVDKHLLIADLQLLYGGRIAIPGCDISMSWHARSFWM